MNFISTFDELNKLYEEAPKAVSKKAEDLFAVMNGDQQIFAGTKEECENWLKDKKSPATVRFKIVKGAEVPVIEEACSKEALTEAAEEEEAEIVEDEIEIIDDEEPVEEVPAEEPVAEEEPKQTIIECSKCGALVIVDEVEVDEASDLVNMKDKCKFCEEKEGYKIVGSVVPYEVVADEEGTENVDEEAVTEEEAPVEDVVEEELVADEKPEEELEELFNIAPAINLNLDGGTGNDVSVLGH